MMMLADFLHLFFPVCCLHCKTSLCKGEQFVCTACLYNLPYTNDHLIPNNSMVSQFDGRVPISYAMALGKFGPASILRQLVYQLKYHNNPKIGIWLGQIYGRILMENDWQDFFQMIIPVPLHATKLHQRGYNQSDYFAQGLSHILNIPWHKDCLQRISYTSPQTMKNKLERLKDLTYAFAVSDQASIQGKHILLVDDVMTTGATLEACATQLLAAGVRKISIATIGRTV